MTVDLVLQERVRTLQQTAFFMPRAVGTNGAGTLFNKHRDYGFSCLGGIKYRDLSFLWCSATSTGDRPKPLSKNAETSSSLPLQESVGKEMMSRDLLW